MASFDELRGLGFSRFPLRYSNTCAVCSKRLPEGQAAYGTKAGRRWMFLCEQCHRKLTKMADDSPPIPEDLIDGVSPTELVSDGDGFMDDEFLASLNLELEGGGFESDPGKVKLAPAPAPVKKTMMQLIQENAEWKF